MVSELHERYNIEQLEELQRQAELDEISNNYSMPSDALLRQGCLDSLERRKKSLYKIMANNSEKMESMLSVTELK